MMRPVKIACGLLLLGTVTGVLVQRSALSAARLENRRLRNESESAVRLAKEGESIEQLRRENQELSRLREETRELHKLRNEVRQLREQTKGLPNVQIENQRLRSSASLQKGAAAPQAPAVQPPTTLDQVGFAGMATPEATFQSFLWAIRQEDLAAFKRCLTPEQQKELESRGDEQIQAQMKGLKNQLKGFRIAAKREVSADEVQLGLQLLVDGKEQSDDGAFLFKKVGSEWKLDMTP